MAEGQTPVEAIPSRKPAELPRITVPQHTTPRVIPGTPAAVRRMAEPVKSPVGGTGSWLERFRRRNEVPPEQITGQSTAQKLVHRHQPHADPGLPYPISRRELRGMYGYPKDKPNWKVDRAIGDSVNYLYDQHVVTTDPNQNRDIDSDDPPDLIVSDAEGLKAIANAPRVEQARRPK